MSDELAEWMREIGATTPAIRKLLMESATDQREAGYFHTLREICQQPVTWNETAARVVRLENAIKAILDGPGDSAGRARAVVLTGSGSSQYAGECLAPALQKDLQLPVFSVAGGAFLTQGASAAPPCRPCVLVSIARSGDSPESCGAVDRMLQGGERHRHLFITCNERGKLARNYRGRPRILAIVLDDRTNDRSLVMTSSFTNLVLAARFLGMLNRPGEYLDLAAGLAACANTVMLRYSQPLAEQAGQDVSIAVFLGSGCTYGAARESALKMLEMTGGVVKAFSESFLGLRHGPMAVIHRGTLVVCFLSASNPARAYELDLIRELDRKRLGARKIVVGEDIPGDMLGEGDLAIECPGLNRLGDNAAPLIYVLVGQILAFFRCLEAGLRPDSPSTEGVISRVVGSFQMY